MHIQATLGLQQLRKLDGFQVRRREIVRRYVETYAPAAGVLGLRGAPTLGPSLRLAQDRPCEGGERCGRGAVPGWALAIGIAACPRARP